MLRCAVCLALFAALAGGTLGCVPYGLPEIISEPHGVAGKARLTRGERRHRRPQVLLITPSHRSIVPRKEDTPVRETIGHQYLLGMIPFTRLFLQHTKESLVIETALKLVGELGADPLVVARDHATKVAHHVQPRAIVAPSLSDLSIVAYDAFFFRLIRVSGTVNLRFLKIESDRGSLILEREVAMPIAMSQFRRRGHAAVLAYLTESELYAALQGPLERYLRSKKRSRRQAQDLGKSISLSPMIELRPVRVHTSIPQTSLQEIANSYGFGNAVTLSPLQVSRLLQRGFAAEAEHLGHPLVSAHSQSAKVGLHGTRIWQLETALKDLSFGEHRDSGEKMLRLTVELSIIEPLRDIGSYPLTSLTCTGTATRPTGVDGAWVVAVERLGREMAAHLFSYPRYLSDGENIHCEEVLDRG